MSALAIRTAADLEVGDEIRAEVGCYLTVTRLNPATREGALAHGEREVWSLSRVVTLAADEPVDAIPSKRRAARGIEHAEVTS